MYLIWDELDRADAIDLRGKDPNFYRGQLEHLHAGQPAPIPIVGTIQGQLTEIDLTAVTNPRIVTVDEFSDL